VSQPTIHQIQPGRCAILGTARIGRLLKHSQYQADP
jgi:hypothetical protein